MEEEYLGKAVSIHCDEKLGIFQGIIKEISASEITIVRAFRNGVPLRKQDAEVTLKATDIYKIQLIPVYIGTSTVTPTVINKPTPVKQPNFANAGNGHQFQQPPQNESSSHENIQKLKNQMRDMSFYMPGPPQRSPPVENFPPAPSTDHTSLSPSNPSVPRAPPTATTNSVAQFFGNLIPPKVEVRMGAVFNPSSTTSYSTGTSSNMEGLSSSKPTAPPASYLNSHGNGKFRNSFLMNSNYNDNGSGDGNASGIGSGDGNGYGNGNGSGNGNGNGNGSGNGNGNGNVNGTGFINAIKKQRRQMRREQNMKQNQTFGSSMDDPLLNEDFDFEGNLALFDKQALWNVIDAEQKPDLVRQAMSMREKKYRHDENVLVSEPLQLRQIETMFESSTDFVTDEGLIIPTIPTFVRSKIEMMAEKSGLSLQRQTDILARGATDLTILLLGGARRFTPNNCHQWPRIAIICDKSETSRVTNTGAATGRQLASHGLKVFLYLEEDPSIELKNSEVSLFKATGNTVVYSVNALPTPDLVILSTNSTHLSGDVKKWLSENRASILAMDPPPNGICDVPIKYAILPILPLNGISSNNCGKLYLCNLGIPDNFYRDAGIKYKSPFGHKFVIPIHSKD